MTPLRVAAGLGALAVATGAFGAHGLRELVAPERLVTWQTAAHYHLVHAVVLLVLATRPTVPRLAFGLLTLGVALFSGSLYLLVLLDQGWLGAVTPFGGVAMIAGWLAAGLAAATPARTAP